MAAASAGIAAIDTPWLDLADVAGAGREAQRARALGYAGKLAIHPTQVASINAAFTATDAELAEAHETVIAFEEAKRAGIGVAVVRGRMIDRPLVLAAQAVIARAELARDRRT
jgi:citrate lyase beta subunit